MVVQQRMCAGTSSIHIEGRYPPIDLKLFTQLSTAISTGPKDVHNRHSARGKGRGVGA